MSLFASIDIGGTYNKYGVVTFHSEHSGAEILWQECLPSHAQDGLDVMLAGITNIVADIIQRTPNVTSLGIGVPGVVDPTTRRVQNPPNLKGWKDVDLLGHIRQSPLIIPTFPVFVENDANCGAIAELCAGAGRGVNDFLYVTLGTGIGGGLIINRQLYVGHNGEAGEVGHMLSGKFPGAKLEDIVGNKGIAQRYGADISVQEIDARANAGDTHALATLTETGTLLGESLCSALAVLGMRTVVVGGGVSRSQHVMNAIRHQLLNIPIPTIRENVQLLQAHFMDHAGLVGAALLGVA